MGHGSASALAGSRPSWHLDDGTFQNNYIGALEKSWGQLRKAFDAEKPPAISFPLARNDPAALRANRTEPTLTWIGHCTLLLQIAGLNVLTDPQFSQRASPVQFAGPQRTTPPGLAIKDLPPIDIVLISHNHYDHLDYRSVRQVAAHSPDAHFYVPLRLGKWFRDIGIKNYTELDWWEEQEQQHLRLVAVPTQHWSNRTFDRNRTLWCGWVLEAADFKFLFIGDTGYSRDFVDIKERFGGFDLAAIPIGAYDPRWFMKEAHQNPEEAVQCMLDLNARKAVATHWGTFQLTFEEMDEPPQRLKTALAKQGLDPASFLIMAHGQTEYL